MNRDNVARIWFTDSEIWIELTDGNMANEKFSNYSRLSKATKQQRENYTLSYYGIHWPEIDEDLSFDGFFQH